MGIADRALIVVNNVVNNYSDYGMMEIFSISKSTTVYYKGIAILLVLLGHFGFVNRGGAFGVNLFLILSGYGCMESFKSKGICDFWKNKFNIYMTYLPFVLCQIIFMWLFDDRVFRDKAIATLVSLTGLDLGFNIDPTMWYISFIFLYYLFFWLTVRMTAFIKNNQIREYVIILVMISLSATVFSISRDNHYLWEINSGAFAYTFSFVAGIILSATGGWKLKKAFIYSCYLGCIILAAAIIIMFYGINGGKYIMIYDFIGGILFVLLSGMHVCPFDKVFGFIGKVSFEIYLVEGFILRVSGPWNEFLPYSWMRGAIAICVSIILGAIGHIIINKCKIKKIKN